MIGTQRQWHKVNGIWFEIELKSAADASPLARDVLLKAKVGSLDPRELKKTYGDYLFAIRKRQLGKRDVRFAELRMAELDKRA